MLHKQFILHYFQYNLVFSLTTFRFDDRFNRKKHAGYSGYIIAEIPVDHTSFIESLRTLAGCFSSTLFLCNPRIFLWDFGQDCFQVIPSSWPWYSWTFFVSWRKALSSCYTWESSVYLATFSDTFHNSWIFQAPEKEKQLIQSYLAGSFVVFMLHLHHIPFLKTTWHNADCCIVGSSDDITFPN